MTVVGYDKRKGSPTYGQVVNFGRWVNATPFSRHAQVSLYEANLTSLDGCSHIQALALLRLSQILPAEDPDKDRYLAGAKRFADIIAELPQYQSTLYGYYPYKNGGTPQFLPFDQVVNQHMATYDGVPGYGLYPYAVPYNTMVTLNDGAMIHVMLFLIEFWKEAKTNPSLSPEKYFTAIKLNVDYLLDRFEISANPDGRGAWAMQYYIEDGSPRAGRPSWGRRYEPPAFSPHAQADTVLMAWHRVETNAARKLRIARALLNWCLYWKFSVKPLNHPSIREDAIKSPAWSENYANYIEGDVNTYHWWTFYNHDPRLAPLNALVSGSRRSEPHYTYSFGTAAMIPPEGSAFLYGMIRDHPRAKIPLILRDGQPPQVELWHNVEGDLHDRDLISRFGTDAGRNLFSLLGPPSTKTGPNMSEIDPATGFILPKVIDIYGQNYVTIKDSNFTSRVSAFVA
jgi:hypothetical protein